MAISLRIGRLATFRQRICQSFCALSSHRGRQPKLSLVADQRILTSYYASFLGLRRSDKTTKFILENRSPPLATLGLREGRICKSSLLRVRES